MVIFTIRLTYGIYHIVMSLIRWNSNDCILWLYFRLDYVFNVLTWEFIHHLGQRRLGESLSSDYSEWASCHMQPYCNSNLKKIHRWWLWLLWIQIVKENRRSYSWESAIFVRVWFRKMGLIVAIWWSNRILMATDFLACGYTITDNPRNTCNRYNAQINSCVDCLVLFVTMFMVSYCLIIAVYFLF